MIENTESMKIIIQDSSCDNGLPQSVPVGTVSIKGFSIEGSPIENNDSFYHDDFYDTVVGFEHKGGIPKAEGNEKTLIEWAGKRFHLIKEERTGDYHKLFMRSLF